MLFQSFWRICAVLFFVAFNAACAAPVVVSHGWARATVPGQTGGAAFFSIASDHPVRVVGVSTPVAKFAELHQMSTTGSTMTMRKIDGIDVGAGATVELTPGGMHVMLFELSQPLVAGQHFTLNLALKEPSGKIDTEPVEIVVRPIGQ